MVRKVTKRGSGTGDDSGGKKLQAKRLRLKRLHRSLSEDRKELQDLPADQLPPASANNAARQARSRLNITFPVNWQELHLRKSGTDSPGEDRSGHTPEMKDRTTDEAE